ncbi:hypothetical protein [Paenibacillus naphthalenovorans]|uniref:Uncharacterized protein n=1 Tax=Paenibacillus naphthalenovorans TaxID=162209 RepID=A0A0U2U7E0_9BACL|nr:hypothetical protein [Paenibacillus naphthalenovorans]ALS22281.1 hypothetical protein IJ22_19070 [Paenibacillus naphthalenovorans]
MSTQLTTYYRFTNSNSPMSDWGHAMFAEDRYKVENYGKNEYTITSDKTVDIYDIKDLIINKWIECQENEYFGSLSETGYWLTVDAEEIFESFNPTNIVDSAEGYDHDIVCWLWEMVLEPNNIMAVRTYDGAVCFDEELIEKIIEAV